jgi:hypothetical protein
MYRPPLQLGKNARYLSVELYRLSPSAHQLQLTVLPSQVSASHAPVHQAIDFAPVPLHRGRDVRLCVSSEDGRIVELTSIHKSQRV